MTKKEIKRRAAIKKELQDKGIIPPDKPRLNRKKFIDDVTKEWEARPVTAWEMYMIRSIYWALSHYDKKTFRISETAVAAAKILKATMELAKLHEGKKRNGEHVTVGDEQKVVSAIFDK